MRIIISTFTLLFLCGAVYHPKALDVTSLGSSVGCENAESYFERFADSDFIVGPHRCEGGLLWLTVSNIWYGFACHEREQLYIVVRDGWRAQNGTNIIFKDIVGTTVAEFRVFSSRPKIRDC